MKKHTLLLFIFIPFLCFSQTNKKIIENYLRRGSAEKVISNADFSDWEIKSDGGGTTSGINVTYVIQRYSGIEIFGAITNFNIKDGQVIGLTTKSVKGISKRVNTTKPSLSIIDALKKAYKELGLIPKTEIEIVEKLKDNKYKLNGGLANLELIESNLVFYKESNGKLLLAWNFTIPVENQKHLWSIRIDAVTGNLLEKNDLVLNCSFDVNFFYENKVNSRVKSFDVDYAQIYTPFTTNTSSGTYRVFPYNIESPSHGSRSLITNAESSLASKYGWHDNNGIPGFEFTTTKGNNVWAKADFLANNDPQGVSPEGGTSLLFDYSYGGIGEQPSVYINAATTNLFYMNNMMHDVWYHHGFNEVNGNFQDNNYGLGGQQNDFVFADSQDGSQLPSPTANNANFSTPIDGGSGRMQMYLWTNVPEIQPIRVNTPGIIAGTYVARQNAFTQGKIDLPIIPNKIESNLVLYTDSPNGIGTSNACSAPLNAAAINGKIVILRLGGTCTSTVKVKFAQNAGAIAVIVVNNNPGEFTLTGTDPTITIPAISVSQEVGEKLITELFFGTVNLTLQIENQISFVNSDGDFDNGIIAHEYGHGISTRLAGGPNVNNCLNNVEQMGEGWSDWFALMMQIKAGDVGTAKRGIGTFVSGQGNDGLGIRSFPYSTDFSINPMTFIYTNNFTTGSGGTAVTSRHGIGSVWATILWDLTWSYIAKYGFDSNLYTGVGGNNKVMKIVLDAIKLQPCNPSFVQARDAIIMADNLLGGKDFCMIWDVFAKRGLGLNASSGDGNVGNDQIENFETPPAQSTCTALSTKEFEKLNIMSIYPNPSKGIVNITVKGYNGLVDVTVIDISGKNVFSLNELKFDNQKQIDFGNLPNGIYLVTIKGVDLNYVTKLVIQ